MTRHDEEKKEAREGTWTSLVLKFMKPRKKTCSVWYSDDRTEVSHPRTSRSLGWIQNEKRGFCGGSSKTPSRERERERQRDDLRATRYMS